MRGHGAGNELFLEGQQSLQTARLSGIVGKPNLLQPHLLDLFFELTVLGANATKIDVVVPEGAAAVLQPDQRTLQRSDRVDRPDADQAGFFYLTAAFFDLHGQTEHLQKQHSHQDDQVAVTAKDGFHKTSGQ